jgi:hypothetical protein
LMLAFGMMYAFDKTAKTKATTRRHQQQHDGWSLNYVQSPSISGNACVVPLKYQRLINRSHSDLHVAMYRPGT